MYAITPRHWFPLLFLGLSTLVCAGCTHADHADAGIAVEGKQDRLVRIYQSDPDTLNLVTSNDSVSNGFQRYVYEGLAETNMANPDKWNPALATSWKYDPKTYTYLIHLRKGVYWHPMKLPSGKLLPKTEFTAKDVLFTFDCILNERIQAASLRSYYTVANPKEGESKYKIKVTKIDKYTVKIQWSNPYFLSKEFTLGQAIMPRHVYSVDENGDTITFDFRHSKRFAKLFNNHWANSKMCGTGPLIFKEWSRNRRAVLVRNPNYWNKAKKYPFSEIVYRHVSNPNTSYQKLLRNRVDVCGISEKALFIRAKKNKNVIAGKVWLKAYDYPGYRYLGYNNKHPFFRDKQVRTALSYAVPVDDIIDKVFYGLANRVTGPFMLGSEFYDETLPFIPHDLKKARKLLDEAGWIDTNGDGVRDKIVGGKKVEAVFDLMIFSTSPTFKQLAQIIAENFRKVGVKANISPVEWQLMLQKLRTKEFDATILGWGNSWKSDPYQIWHGSQANLPNSSNSIGYSNPKVDKLIDELRITIDEKKQAELGKAIHRLIYEDQPYTFLFSEKATVGFSGRIIKDSVKFYRPRPCTDSSEWRTSKPMN